MNEVQRVERHIFVKDRNLEDLTHKSKNLYNYCNYLIRQHFIKTGEFMNEYLLSKALSKYNQVDYRNMPTAQSGQQVIKLLFKNWKSFFKSIKDYSKNTAFGGKT